MKIQKSQKKQQSSSITEKKTKAKQTKTVTIQDLVKNNAKFQIIGNGKVRCKITNHEFAGTVENFQNYIKSKSYKRGIESQFDISQYEDILIPHRDGPMFLYCQITGAKVAKKKSAIEKHVKGKRFVKALQQLKKMHEQDEKGQQKQDKDDEIEDQLAEFIDDQADQQEQQQQQEQQVNIKQKDDNKHKKISKKNEQNKNKPKQSTNNNNKKQHQQNKTHNNNHKQHNNKNKNNGKPVNKPKPNNQHKNKTK